jgi:hypothetical protein
VHRRGEVGVSGVLIKLNFQFSREFVRRFLHGRYEKGALHTSPHRQLLRVFPTVLEFKNLRLLLLQHVLVEYSNNKLTRNFEAYLHGKESDSLQQYVNAAQKDLHIIAVSGTA